MNRRISNWVDRGTPVQIKLTHVLSVYLGLRPNPSTNAVTLDAETICAMVQADAGEMQVAAYLLSIEEREAVQGRLQAHRRAAAIALWHIAKCGLLRGGSI